MDQFNDPEDPFRTTSLYPVRRRRKRSPGRARQTEGSAVPTQHTYSSCSDIPMVCFHL